jgi:3-dehydroquinate dehydratase / shikimate dehydrogenase
MSNRLCLCLTGDTLAKDEEFLKLYVPPADLAELRVDMLQAAEYLKIPDFTEKLDIPLILTLRRKLEGGKFEGPEKERMTLLADILQKGRFDYVDLEEDGNGKPLEVLEVIAEEKKCRIIRSFHNSEGGWMGKVEEKAGGLFRRFPKQDIIKIAHYCRTTKDLEGLLNFSKRCQMQYSDRDVIIIGMGEFGIPSRILSSRFGSYLSFASPSEKQRKKEEKKLRVNYRAAPGQLDPITMEDLYRFHKIHKETKIYGIIGDPVLHSRSPEIHNRGFQHLGLDAVYIPFPVDDPKSFYSLAKALDIRGFSVTLPHKERIIPLLDSIGEEVRAIGSCNTVLKRGIGYQGRNFDYLGFLSPLKAVLATEEQRRRRTLVIGAGGAARAVLYGLRSLDTEIYLTNRTKAKGKALAEEFSCRFCAYRPAEVNKVSWDIIVQTTSLGMIPRTEEMPLEGFRFSGEEIVYDCIYTPPKTLFLQRAEEAGAKIINGLGMLLGQAYHQFREFTGRDYPCKREGNDLNTAAFKITNF